MNRRTLVKLTLGGATASVLAACGLGSQPPAPTNTATAPPAPTTSATNAPLAARPTLAAVGATSTSVPSSAAGPTPKSGGVLKQAYLGDPTSLDPMLKVGNDAVWIGVFERLTTYDDTLKPQPMLAESWDISSDAKQIKFNLRKGVQFHSGRELTSDDVKYSLQRAANPKVAAAQYTGMASWFSGVETPDKYTAIFQSELPRPTIFDLLEFLQICDKDSIEGGDPKTTAVGTGPFTFVEWVPGDHVSLAKNPNYWQSGKPYLDRIEIPIGRDQQAMVTQLEGGTADIIVRPALSDFNRLKTDPKYAAVPNPLTGSHYEAGFNLLQPPFDNKMLRQALSYAMDRGRFVSTILGGVGAAESLPWLPDSPAYEPAKMNAYAFDLDKARSLLNQAGVSELEFDYLPNPVNEQTTGFGQIYQADLAKLGLKMNIRNIDNATWLDQVNGRKFNGMYMASGTYFNLSPSTAFTNGKAFNPDLNNSAFKSDQYAQLITQGATETDAAKLKQVYSQLNDLVLDESFVFMITISPPTYLARTNVQGVRWTAHESLWYADAWLA